MGEEIGWSGFLTPKLRKVFSIPLTSVIVGVYWAVWHFPAINWWFLRVWYSFVGFPSRIYSGINRRIIYAHYFT
ncbi:type II CAAX prenyl endopeptidase Rce1 family protein [Bacteroidota bacterium]